MGLFRSDRGTKMALERLHDALRDLRDRVSDLETAHKRLALEWEELYDKVRHQMSRMSRRARVDVVPDDGPTEPDNKADGASGLDPISARILSRRSGHGRQQ